MMQDKPLVLERVDGAAESQRRAMNRDCSRRCSWDANELNLGTLKRSEDVRGKDWARTLEAKRLAKEAKG